MITEEIEDEFRPHSIPYVVTGTFILWVSWLFFNAGSSFTIVDLGDIRPEHVMMNTFLAASTGGLFSVFFKNRITCSHTSTNKYDLGAICNGILCGLVSITGPCHNVTPFSALVIGIIGATVYSFSTKLLYKLKIDDPIEAT